MSFNNIPNKSFLNDLKFLSKKYPSLKNDINNVVLILKENPKTGEPLGRDCFKIRLSIKSKATEKEWRWQINYLCKNPKISCVLTGNI